MALPSSSVGAVETGYPEAKRKARGIGSSDRSACKSRRLELFLFQDEKSPGGDELGAVRSSVGGRGGSSEAGRPLGARVRSEPAKRCDRPAMVWKGDDV